MQRLALSFAAATALVAAAAPSFAQEADSQAKPNAVPTTVLFGTITPNQSGTSNNFCALPAGTLAFSASSSTFQRGSGKKADAHIQFANFDYYARPLDYNFGGLATLQFSDSQSGTVAFDVPPYWQNVNNGTIQSASGYAPTFSDYSQSYSGSKGVLTVSFNLVFPPQNGGGTCTIPVAATYHSF